MTLRNAHFFWLSVLQLFFLACSKPPISRVVDRQGESTFKTFLNGELIYGFSLPDRSLMLIRVEDGDERSNRISQVTYQFLDCLIFSNRQLFLDGRTNSFTVYRAGKDGYTEASLNDFGATSKDASLFDRFFRTTFSEGRSVDQVIEDMRELKAEITKNKS